ncbi:uncharacterized protein BJX67DRAFT_121588 [Aspergillus lucknowensis]|uniref:Uncharacterized protein n=1 Tax=Aspergillus lucknowensis TaxID=176173 RepID=A0ABR4LQ64_9EURO
MLSFTVQMDLSSLEGPPTLDSRFSGPAPSTSSVPHIRLDDVLSPVSPLESRSWDLPPRPASANAISPRSKHPDTRSNGFWQSTNPNNNVTSAPRSNPTQPTHSTSFGASQSQPTTSSTLTAPSRRSSRSQSSSISNPHQLVWVESEQIWILTTRTAPPTPPHQRSQSSLSPTPHAGTAAGRAGPLSHSRSMELFPSGYSPGDPEPEDVPPPYEHHIFDQPLGPILPAVTRVRPEEMPSNRGSRWAAVGRRVR